MKIFNTTYVRFSFLDRIRILLGREVKVDLTICTEKEVKVLNGQTESVVYVKPFFKKKPIQLESPK